MALAEARVAGVPILARAAGNAAAHVDREAGGQLFASVAELAQSCLELSRSRALREARIAQARAHATEARPWSQAARQFLLHAENLEK
jgi:glycosyltransferase involved in cell wall biosynthesis